jgi:hypothetical protein
VPIADGLDTGQFSIWELAELVASIGVAIGSKGGMDPRLDRSSDWLSRPDIVPDQ